MNKCLICSKTCKNLKVANDCQRTKSLFNNLFRYINLDVAKLNLEIKGDDGLGLVSVCEGCQNILENVSRLYGTLERIRMDMDRQMEAILQKKGSEVKVNPKRRRMRASNHSQSEDFNQLRGALMQKCSLKISKALPRVRVERIISMETTETDSGPSASSSNADTTTLSAPPAPSPEISSFSAGNGLGALNRKEEVPSTSATLPSSSSGPNSNGNGILNGKPKPRLKRRNFTRIQKRRLEMLKERIWAIKARRKEIKRKLKERKARKRLRNSNGVVQEPLLPPPQSKSQYSCHVCQKVFKLEKELLEHNLRLHSKPDRNTYGCHLCDRSFSRDHLVQEHLHRVHRMPKFRCDFPGCGQLFSRKIGLTSHKEAEHPELHGNAEVTE